MAGGITYADLRFARSSGEGPSEGELTYENVQVPRGPEKEAAERVPLKEAPGPPCWATACHRWRPVTRRLMLGALALCLVLLVTNITLGVQYLRASRQLQQVSRDHTAQSRILGERSHHLQAHLEESGRQLRLTKEELNSTTEALWQSRAGENQTQQQLQHQERSLALLQRERARLEDSLIRASSCRQIGCCPSEWTLFRWKCLWASSERKTWWRSKEDCEHRSSRLLVLSKPWSPRELWEAVGGALTQRLESQELESFWVGLRKEKGTWKWVDGSHYEGSEIGPWSHNSWCAVMQDGQLSLPESSQTYRFICERAASPEAL